METTTTTTTKSVTEVTKRRESLRRGSLLAVERRNSAALQLKEANQMTSKKLYGKDLSAYDDMDIDDILQQLSPDEIEILSREVDPDDSLLPASQRCSYFCTKEDTGKLDRKQLIDHINKQALEEPDRPEMVPFEAGTVRGKRWIPPVVARTKQEEEVEIDLGGEYENALGKATEDDLVDLAAILGFHSMMNQDQYHASLLNKGQTCGTGWGGITKATKYKPLPNEPPNTTDAEDVIQRVQNDDANTKDICWNNIKNISAEKFGRLFEAIKTNTRLESLSLCNCNLNDRIIQPLIDTLRVNHTLKILSLESNYITPPCLRDLISVLNTTKSIEEFRAANQKPEVLGNKIEMDITSLIEQNPTILRLGLHFEYNDARDRVAKHLQKNRDKLRRKRLEAEDRLRRIGRPARNYLGGIVSQDFRCSKQFKEQEFEAFRRASKEEMARIRRASRDEEAAAVARRNSIVEAVAASRRNSNAEVLNASRRSSNAEILAASRKNSNA